MLVQETLPSSTTTTAGGEKRKKRRKKNKWHLQWETVRSQAVIADQVFNKWINLRISMWLILVSHFRHYSNTQSVVSFQEILGNMNVRRWWVLWPKDDCDVMQTWAKIVTCTWLMLVWPHPLTCLLKRYNVHQVAQWCSISEFCHDLCDHTTLGHGHLLNVIILGVRILIREHAQYNDRSYFNL